jgi:hypothetical protein
MAPLVCPAPDIVDHTFPRSVRELRLVRKSLGKLLLLIEQESCKLLLTHALRDFIVELEERFDWTKMGEFPQLQMIYHILAQFGLQQRGVQTVDVSDIAEYSLHPLPVGCTQEGFALRWSDELGRLVALHSKCCRAGRFFIGVACTHAFADEAKGAYDNPGGAPSFPLVGPDDIPNLEDSQERKLPPDIRQRRVTFNDVFRRVNLLGGEVNSPTASSHYQVRFKGARTWPLDSNLKDIPDDFLKELEPITGLEIAIIKYVLLFGEWPPWKSRLPS